eukprot:TRINITY_DN7663_c0_g1_i2.p1 TRINITY_DN7663_c0_g1~~TRINITY_DN7663_c0_g1_i2.p1  ORF type:complete len:178 (+),score=26.02 TRINITY_DN7663_c0_g1_i2:31-534(+)
MDEAQLSSAVAQLRQAANALRALTAARARSSSQQDEPAPKRQRSATPEAAPQPVVRFSRVQLSKVQFANEQLKDNSYAFKQSDFGTVRRGTPFLNPLCSATGGEPSGAAGDADKGEGLQKGQGQGQESHLQRRITGGRHTIGSLLGRGRQRLNPIFLVVVVLHCFPR